MASEAKIGCCGASTCTKVIAWIHLVRKKFLTRIAFINIVDIHHF